MLSSTRCMGWLWPTNLHRLSFLQGLAQAQIFLPRAAMLEGLGDQAGQVIGVEGLHDVVVGAVLERLHRGLHGSVAGHDDDDDVRIDLADLAVQLQAVHAGHLDVQQGQVPALARQLQQRLARAVGGVHAVAFFLEPFSQRVPDDVFVVDDQDAGLGIHNVLLATNCRLSIVDCRAAWPDRSRQRRRTGHQGHHAGRPAPEVAAGAIAAKVRDLPLRHCRTPGLLSREGRGARSASP